MGRKRETATGAKEISMSTNTAHKQQQTAVVYARVSSEEQVQGYSIQAQLRACREWAGKHGYKVAKEYLDEGYSASRNLDKRESFKEMLGDAASAAAVIVAGVIVLATGNPLADPIVSFIIAALILWSSWGILKESVNVLLEATPAGLHMPAVENAISCVDGVLDVHDLHVWTVGPGVVACSCHVVVAEQTISSGQQVLRAVVSRLNEQFKINHTTVQVEVEGCEANDMYCHIHRAEPSHAGHHH